MSVRALPRATAAPAAGRSASVIFARHARCSSLIGADGLTVTRRAAALIELPRSTARTIRRRTPLEKQPV
jgi:hypothetical protein